MADQLQRAAPEPPGDRGHGAGVRPGTNAAGRGAAVPAPEQPESPNHQPEGDQSPASDVAGRHLDNACRWRLVENVTAQLGLW